MAPDNEKPPRLHSFLAHMIAEGASDLHLASGSRPLYRVHGTLEAMEYVPLEETVIGALLAGVATEQQTARIEAGDSFSFGYEMERPRRSRFRISVFPERRGLSAAIRHIPSRPPRLAELGLPPIVPNLTQGNWGLVVVCGATGSGKSTTLAACIQEINHEIGGHVITLEDPIEYVFENEKALVHQREVGVHAPSFEVGAEEALRQDPDILVVGEVRSAEEISKALLAAETGHLVFTTVHANSAAKAIGRLISAFPAAEQEMVRLVLAETLRAVVAQKLLPKADGTGRVAAIEILGRSNATTSLIREGRTNQLYTQMQSSRDRGMVTMSEALVRLVRSREITVETALEVANDVTEVRDRLGRS